MIDYLILLSGIFAGLIVGIPCGIALSAHRHTAAGCQVQSDNWLIALVSRPPKSFSIPGRIAFIFSILCWLIVFFSAIAAPPLIARLCGLPDNSPGIGDALQIEFFVGIVGVGAGYLLWKRIAYS